jgi:hypothetical protein
VIGFASLAGISPRGADEVVTEKNPGFALSFSAPTSSTGEMRLWLRFTGLVTAG